MLNLLYSLVLTRGLPQLEVDQGMEVESLISHPFGHTKYAHALRACMLACLYTLTAGRFVDPDLPSFFSPLSAITTLLSPPVAKRSSILS